MRTLLIIVTVALAPLTMAQGIDDTPQDKVPGVTLTGENDRNDQQEHHGSNDPQRVVVDVNVNVKTDPRWLTREGVEETAKAYFEGKRQFVQCRNRGDGAGMRKAQAQMREMNSRLDAYKKAQAKIDNGQDAKISDLGTKVSDLNGRVSTLETSVNGDGKKELGLTKRVQELETENETYALSGVPERLATAERSISTNWILTLGTLVLCVIGFLWRPRRRS